MLVIADLAGWIGSVCVLAAFWLLTHKVVHSHSYSYLMLNLAGGFLLGFDAWRHGAHAAASLNVVWVVIALYGLGWAHKRKEPKLKR